jgi:hypothetical protein
MALDGPDRRDKHSNEVYSIKTPIRMVLRRKPKKKKKC